MKVLFCMCIFFVGLMALVIVAKDRKIDQLEKRLEQIAPPETVFVEIIRRDTVFVLEADTVEVAIPILRR